MSHSPDPLLLTEISRDLVAQVAPQELVVFGALSHAYLENPDKVLRQQRAKEDMLGFGFETASAFFTPVALAVTGSILSVLTEIVRKSITDEGAGQVREKVRRMFKKFRGAEAEEHAQAPPLTNEQMARVRALALEQGQRLKLPADQARLLADSIVGSLALAP